MKKRKIKFTDKKHSRNGILSTILGAVSAGLLFCLLAAAYLTSGQAGKAVAVLGLLAFFVACAGAWYGCAWKTGRGFLPAVSGSWNRYQWTVSGRICVIYIMGMVTSMEMNETLRERQQLAYERIRQIAADPEINGSRWRLFSKDWEVCPVDPEGERAG